MLSTPKRHEIDHRTLKLIVGLIAITLPGLTSYFAHDTITSISESYYIGGTSQEIFIGFLFAIASFLLAYNGESTGEMVLSKIAAVAALGVAMFPCKCGSHTEVTPYVHGTSAAVMFVILAFFCRIFYQRARAEGHTEARRRAWIYAACGLAILLSIAVLAIDSLTGGRISRSFSRLTFYGEATGLIAFGISWLTASHIFPGLARKDERVHPFK